MGKIPKDEGAKKTKCSGGRSYHCKHSEHERGKEIWCQRCHAYMGCIRCTQIPQEVFCLNCRDWALEVGEKEHGKVLPRAQGVKLFAELIKEITPWLDKLSGGRLHDEEKGTPKESGKGQSGQAEKPGKEKDPLAIFR